MLDLSRSEGLWFTGTDLARWIGRRLTSRDVNGIVDGQAGVVKLLADELASPTCPKPHLRLFTDCEPYVDHPGRFSQSTVVFACVDSLLVNAWRRPFTQLRGLIETLGKVLDFEFNTEDPECLHLNALVHKRVGRPPLPITQDIERIIARDKTISNAELARRLKVSRQTVMRARERLVSGRV